MSGGQKKVLLGYDEYEIYVNFEIFEDPYNVIYEADINQDGEVDYKQEIDVDKNGRIDIVKYGIEDPEDPSQVLWYSIIQDFVSYSKSVQKSYDSSHTEWFDISDNALRWCVDYNIEDIENYEESYVDYWAQRNEEHWTRMESFYYSRFYSVKVDQDLDGYGDFLMEYKRESTTIEYTIHETHKTSVGLRELGEYLPEVGLSVDEFLGLRSYEDFEDYLNENNFPLEDIPRVGEQYYNLEYDYCFDFLKKYAQVYIENIFLEHIYYSSTDEITYYDMEEGQIAETRYYSDEFVNDESFYVFEEDIEKVSVTSSDLGTTCEINPAILHVNYTTDKTWGPDDVPVKFDLLITTTEGYESITNYHEKTIIIRIPNRYSLFKDYLVKTPSEKANDDGSTLFRITGIFITPPSGVFYTSDKASFDDGDAKTSGHYLFYDSDSNGFLETVFILSPDTDGDGIYNVMSVGYNYDNSYEFSPYEVIALSENRFGTVHLSGSRTVQAQKINHQYLKLDLLDIIDAIYPKDLSDGKINRDNIFEISKLVEHKSSKLYPELYYQVYKREYAKAYHCYEQRLWEDVLNQVLMTTIAGTLSALASLIWAPIAPFVFAIVYFALSYAQKLKQYETEDAMKTSRLYYDNSLNEKRDFEIGERSHEDHPGAYYTTVFGGEPGNMYEGLIMATHPKDLREECGIGTDNDMRFIDYNLDYLFLTSEILSLPDVLNRLYPSQGENNEYYSLTYYISDSERNSAYRSYRTNTIGYLEQIIDIETDGKFDAIRPYCINGQPQYMFINSQSETTYNTFPLSPLYQPVIVSFERYQELKKEGLIPESILHVRADCAYGSFHDTAFKAYELYPSEREQFAAKISLSNKEFNYPITKIVIDYSTSTSILRSVEVSSSDYTVIDGILYFYRPLEEIIFSSKSDWENKYISIQVSADYNVHIHFSTIIPYSDSGYISPSYLRLNPEYQLFDREPTVLDTTSDDNAKLVLAQTTEYALLDYFNQFEMGLTDGTDKAGRDYTVLVTFWSTLISNLILLPISFGISSIMSPVSKSMVGLQFAKIPISVATEIVEELYVDPIIEDYCMYLTHKLGGSERLGEFWGMLATSFREAIIGGVSDFAKGRGGSDIDMNLNEALLDTQKTIDELTPASYLKNALKQNLGGIILTGLTSFFSGGLGLGILTTGLEMSFDLAENWVKGRYLRPILGERLTELERARDYRNMLKAAPNIKGYDQLIFGRKPVSTQQFSEISDPMHLQDIIISKSLQDIHPTQVANLDLKTQLKLFSMRKGIIDATLLALSESRTSLEQKRENIEENSQLIGRLRDTSEENYIEQIESDTSLGTVIVDDSLVATVEDPKTFLVDFGYRGTDLYKKFNGPGFLSQEIPQFIDFLHSQYRLKYQFDIYLADYSQEWTQEDYLNWDFEKLEKIQFGETIIDKNGELQVLGDTIRTLDQLFDAKGMDKSNPSELFILVPKDLLALTGALPGFAYIRSHYAHLFKGLGNFDAIFNNRLGDALILEKFYEKVIKPLSNKFFRRFNFIGRDGFKINDIQGAFKAYFARMWKSVEVKEFFKDSTEAENIWNKFLDKLFDEMFAEGFKYADMKDLNHLHYVLRDRASLAVFDVIMRRYIKIDSEGLDLSTIPDEIEKFINNFLDPSNPLRNEVNKILFGNYDDALKTTNPEHIKIRFFNFLAETFFADPRTNRLVINRDPGKFFGFSKEAMYFFYDLPIVIAEFFAKENFRLEDFYSHIKYSFSDKFFKELNEKILNGIDISGIFPESSRWPDLNVYEFLSVVISNHMKSTHLQEFTTSGYADMVRIDGLSGLILDYYRQVMNDREEVPNHILELIIPIKDKNEALDVFNRLIRMRPQLEDDFEETFYNLYSSNSFKVPEQHVFLFRVTQLLNKLIQSDQREISTVDELRDSIEDIFNNKDLNIYSKLQELVFDIFRKEDKRKMILNQGFLGGQFYNKIKELFTSKSNLLKLAVPSDYSTNKLELSWGAYIDFWFDTNEEGQKVKFDSSLLNKNKIFLLEDGNEKKLPSNYKYDKVMVVIHYIDDKNTIHIGICPESEVDSLPSKYQEGLPLMVKGKFKVFHNVYICDKEGFQLFGKIIINDNGEFAINPNDRWTLELLKGQEIYLKDRNNFKRYSRLQNREIDIYTTHFFTAVGYATGNNYISTLQETTVNIIPNHSYKSYLPSEVIDTERTSFILSPKFTFRPIAAISDKFIAIQEFYELYYNIIDFHVQGAAGYSYPNIYILDLLDELNTVFDPYSGYTDPNSKRSIEDIEGILNMLFKNKAEICDFLLIDKFGSPLHDTEMSIKDWISFIFDKITDPELELSNDRLSLLLKGALAELDRYKAESGLYINPFNIEKRQFADTGIMSELDHGKFVYDVISRLFGHFTLIYLFLHRIDFYEAPSGFKLDFYTINPTSREIESLIAQYNIRASSQESRWGALLHQSISEHTFSILFSNSFMYLPTETGIMNEDNRVYFGYSPLPFLSDHLSGSTLQELNKKLLDSFKIGYDHYISCKDIGSVYTESCSAMLKVFSTRLWDTVSSLNLGFEETNALYEQALLQAKYEIFRLDPESNNKFTIRYQIENLLIGYQYSQSRFVDSENIFQRGIVFHNLKVQKTDRFGNVILDDDGNPVLEPLIVFLSKDDFKGRNIQVYRKVSEQFPELYNTLNQGFLQSTIDRLYTVVHIILKNGGNVRFYTTMNRGPQYGYQYINIVPGKSFQHLRSYYDINFDLDESGKIKPTEFNQIELQKVQFLVALSGTYIEYFNKIKSSVMLIMKEESAGMGDSSICGINHNNIFRIKHIYSQYGAPDGDGYILQQIYGSLSNIGSYYIGPNNNIDPDKIWSQFSNFQPVSQGIFLNFYDSSIWG